MSRRERLRGKRNGMKIGEEAVGAMDVICGWRILVRSKKRESVYDRDGASAVCLLCPEIFCCEIMER